MEFTYSSLLACLMTLLKDLTTQNCEFWFSNCEHSKAQTINALSGNINRIPNPLILETGTGFLPKIMILIPRGNIGFLVQNESEEDYTLTQETLWRASLCSSALRSWSVKNTCNPVGKGTVKDSDCTVTKAWVAPLRKASRSWIYYILTFYLSVLPVTERNVLNSAAMIVDLSVFLFNSVTFFLLAFWLLL